MRLAKSARCATRSLRRELLGQPPSVPWRPDRRRMPQPRIDPRRNNHPSRRPACAPWRPGRCPMPQARIDLRRNNRLQAPAGNNPDDPHPNTCVTPFSHPQQHPRGPGTLTALPHPATPPLTRRPDRIRTLYTGINGAQAGRQRTACPQVVHGDPHYIGGETTTAYNVLCVRGLTGHPARSETMRHRRSAGRPSLATGPRTRAVVSGTAKRRPRRGALARWAAPMTPSTTKKDGRDHGIRFPSDR